MYHEARKPNAAGNHDPFRSITDPIEMGDENGRHRSGDDRTEPHPLSELRALMERARRGDNSVLPRLRVLLDENPGVLGDFGNLATHAEAEWIGTISGTDFGLAEGLKTQIAGLKSTLAGPAPTPVEKLLLTAVVVAWLNHYWTELMAAKLAQREKILIQDWNHMQTSLNQAQRRYTLAVSALVTYQRLLPAAKDATFVVTAPNGDRLDAQTARQDAATAAGFAPWPGPATPSDDRPCGNSEEAVILGVFEPEATVAARGGKARRKRAPRSASS